jgi:hypothetical protein
MRGDSAFSRRAPLIQHHHPVGETSRQGQIVQADQYPASSISPGPQPLQHQKLGVGVQPRDRLVRRQQGRWSRQGAGQQYSRPLTARHLGDAAIRQMADAHLVQRGASPVQGGGARQERRAQRRQLDRRKIPGDGTVLRQIGRTLAPLTLGQPSRLVAAQTRGALRQSDQPQCGAHRRRLARTVRPAQGHNLARPHGQGSALQHFRAADTGVRVRKLQQRRRHSRHSRAARQAIRANRGAPTRAVKTPSFNS